MMSFSREEELAFSAQHFIDVVTEADLYSIKVPYRGKGLEQTRRAALTPCAAS